MLKVEELLEVLNELYEGDKLIPLFSKLDCLRKAKTVLIICLNFTVTFSCGSQLEFSEEAECVVLVNRG